jgi:hypothetical protein
MERNGHTSVSIESVVEQSLLSNVKLAMRILSGKYGGAIVQKVLGVAVEERNVLSNYNFMS